MYITYVKVKRGMSFAFTSAFLAALRESTPKYPLLLMVKAFQEKLFDLRFERMGVR